MKYRIGGTLKGRNRNLFRLHAALCCVAFWPVAAVTQVTVEGGLSGVGGCFERTVLASQDSAGLECFEVPDLSPESPSFENFRAQKEFDTRLIGTASASANYRDPSPSPEGNVDDATAIGNFELFVDGRQNPPGSNTRIVSDLILDREYRVSSPFPYTVYFRLRGELELTASTPNWRDIFACFPARSSVRLELETDSPGLAGDGLRVVTKELIAPEDRAAGSLKEPVLIEGAISIVRPYVIRIKAILVADVLRNCIDSYASARLRIDDFSLSAAVAYISELEVIKSDGNPGSEATEQRVVLTPQAQSAGLSFTEDSTESTVRVTFAGNNLQQFTTGKLMVTPLARLPSRQRDSVNRLCIKDEQELIEGSSTAYPVEFDSGSGNAIAEFRVKKPDYDGKQDPACDEPIIYRLQGIADDIVRTPVIHLSQTARSQLKQEYLSTEALCSGGGCSPCGYSTCSFGPKVQAPNLSDILSRADVTTLFPANSPIVKYLDAIVSRSDYRENGLLIVGKNSEIIERASMAWPHTLVPTSTFRNPRRNFSWVVNTEGGGRAATNSLHQTGDAVDFKGGPPYLSRYECRAGGGSETIEAGNPSKNNQLLAAKQCLEKELNPTGRPRCYDLIVHDPPHLHIEYERTREGCDL